MDGDNGIAPIVLARKKHPRLDTLQAFGQRVNFALDIGHHRLALARQLKQRLNVGGGAVNGRYIGEWFLQALSLLHHLLAVFGLIPEIRTGDLGFEFR